MPAAASGRELPQRVMHGSSRHAGVSCLMPPQCRYLNEGNGVSIEHLQGSEVHTTQTLVSALWLGLGHYPIRLVKGGKRIDMTRAIAVHRNAGYRRSHDHARKEREP